MTDPSCGAKPLRVLLSEGSSTSAREAITALGLAGHIVEVCDPSPVCLGRFSRFVSKFHRCPGLRDDPADYLSFVEKLLAERPFDVLLPIHEQGFMFARVRERFETRIGLALPVFESYRTAHSKAGFSRLLDELRMPQPATRIVTSPSELRDAVRFPCVVKTSIGTASRGIWFVRDDSGLLHVLQELAASEAFADEVLVQELVAGAIEKPRRYFRTANCSAFMPTGKLPPAPVAAKRSSKACGDQRCAPMWRKLGNGSAGTAHCRSTSSCRSRALISLSTATRVWSSR
jgi:hypothetical protein